MIDSLDPRIKRWNLQHQREHEYGSSTLDQLPTYEVFVQLREGKAYEHAGIVHAASDDMAFLFAKEQFSRRNSCYGMWVAPSEKVWVTGFTDMEENVYDVLDMDATAEKLPVDDFDVFHLYKRGKQHRHVGRVKAHDIPSAVMKARGEFNDGRPVLNVWLIRSVDIRVTRPEDQVIWSTLKDKTHREVISYRAGDKLKNFKQSK